MGNRALRRSRIGTVAFGLAALLFAGQLAHALPPLYNFTGTVRDAWSRPLGGATVSDGSQSTTTVANGAPNEGTYTLPESSTGTFTLRASRNDTGVAPQTVTVTLPVTTTVDFTLFYKIWGAFSSPYISTASGPVTRNLTVSTYAPSPSGQAGLAGTSCVYVTDSRTSATSLAQLVSYNATTRLSTWTHPVSLAQNATEGFFTISMVAKDCGAGTVLTLSPAPTTWYIIDNTSPTIDAKTITPLDHGNSRYLIGQPLLARIKDTSGSGVNISSVVFTRLDDRGTTDPTDDTTATFPAVSYSAATGWAKTAALPIVEGHTYKVSVSAEDQAGNTVAASHRNIEDGGGFLAVANASFGAARASIPRTTCSVSTEAVLGQKTVTCQGVPLDLGPTFVTLPATRHSGIGYVEREVSLAGAKLRVGINGTESPQPLDAYNANDAAWGPRRLSTQFVVTTPSKTTQTVRQAPLKARIGTLTAKIPAIWTDASLEMTETETTPTLRSCPDPAVATYSCTPDPLRFFIADEWSSIVEDTEQDIISERNLGVPIAGTNVGTDTIRLNFFAVYVPSTNRICIHNDSGEWPICVSPPVPAGATPPPHWEATLPIGGCANAACTTPCDGGSTECFLEYQDYPAIDASYFGSVCNAGLAQCTSPEYEASAEVGGNDTESEYTDTLVLSSSWDWLPGECYQDICDSEPNRDLRHFSASAYIGRGVKTPNGHQECDRIYDPTPPFICYGFNDGSGLDGLSGAWPGTWTIPFLSDTTTNRHRQYYSFAAYQFCSKTVYLAPSQNCFYDSPTKAGGFNEKQHLTWDVYFKKSEGKCPLDWSTCDPGNVKLESASRSGAFQARHHGQFWRYSTTQTWATYAYSLGGELYQTDDGVPQKLYLDALFTHRYKNTTWSWQPNCGFPDGCRWTISPSSNDQNWNKPAYHEGDSY